MLTTSRARVQERRGIALILILGMLGLLAFIGVTFATIAGQARIGARNYAQSVMRPQPADLMEFALSQLIGDTDDPRSAIRGHSLARDMYGNDAENYGYVDASAGVQFTAAQDVTDATIKDPFGRSLLGTIQCRTSIPAPTSAVAAYYGYDFSRWVVKFNGVGIQGLDIAQEAYMVGETFEVVYDDAAGFTVGGSNYRIFYLSPRPAQASGQRSGASPESLSNFLVVQRSALISEYYNAYGMGAVPLYTPVTLDGRFLRAFNGPGMGPLAQYPNMRYNGGMLQGTPLMADGVTPMVFPGDPNVVGMDEDYDACDLENWFLAIQSADGKTIVPSFHRPGILQGTDWTSNSALSRSKILRPRSADGNDPVSFPNLNPGPANSYNERRITFDVDNDADGTTDSVWVDLGYPPIRDNRGQLYKPMFAFMVVGLNGRIPLNTAGNLNRRDGSGAPTYMHASHLGYSPSEVDPSYGLQASPLVNGASSPFTQLDNAGNGNTPISVNVTQLRNILAGTRLPDPYAYSGATTGDRNLVQATGYRLPNNVPDFSDNFSSAQAVIATPAVAGRWGEPSFITSYFNYNTITPMMVFPNMVRAGMSVTGTSQLAQTADGRDDDGTVSDSWPSFAAGALPEFPGSGQPLGTATHPDEAGHAAPWPADYYDAALDRPVFAERARRFVTPIDLNGDGRQSKYTGSGSGADALGRVRYSNYFRPPGAPPATADGAAVLTSVPGQGTTVAGAPSVYDVTNNLYHGFESQRNPSLTGASDWLQALRSAAAPTSQDPDGGNGGADYFGNPLPTSGGLPYDADGNPIGTFNASVNSLLPGSPGLNDPNETNLYVPNAADQIFGAADLEWLYRAHDVDGQSLRSRLSDLAPLSFRDTIDSMRRRRLYSIDVWETNAFAWTNDNPGGYAANGVYNGGSFSDDSRFPSPFLANPNTNYPAAVLALGAAANAGMPSLAARNVPFVAAPSVRKIQSAAPNLPHRDRKINLNYPLPVSNDPNEATRLKWIAETYQFLKVVLPLKSVDTPEELAQLSQFLVNIIDFRDPDATMTRFTNPDVFVRAGAAGQAPDLILRTNPAWNAATDAPLVQFGMEYNPIAINEVLAYAYQTKVTSPSAIPRFFIELVNTLTDAQTAYPTPPNNHSTPNSSWLTLGGVQYAGNDPYGANSGAGACWDLIFTDDDPSVRPDPFTGQLPGAAATGYYGPLPLHRGSFTGNQDVVVRPLTASGLPAAGAAANYFYCIGNTVAIASNETGTPAAPKVSQSITPSYDPFQEPSGQGTPTFTIPAGVLPNNATAFPPKMAPPTAVQTGSTYKWVCLRRPANPFAGASAANPMVVVDAMRFPFIEATGVLTGSTVLDDKGNPVPDTSKANQVYSSERFQPYRGGQLVPQVPTVLGPPRYLDVARYGYTEQTVPAKSSKLSTQGIYSKSADNSKTYYATKTIFESLGVKNDNTEDWDRFVFNDRDFVSPAELMLVPGCPPGLFTKQFVEFAPSTANQARFYSAGNTQLGARNVTPPPSTTVPNSLGVKLTIDPPTFPYLVDQLFYTSASPAYNGGPTWDPVVGPSSGGWYKMFEFLEVPSTVVGATGPVSQGVNYDRLRQDVRPGQLNLNLIVDEEVFLGLMGNAGVRADNPPTANDLLGNGDNTPLQAVLSAPTYLNGLLTATPSPRVVTQVDAVGRPTASYNMTNVGFYDSNLALSTLKQAFIDFLTIRHGANPFPYFYVDPSGNAANNTNVLYFGAPPPLPGQTVWPTEAPFRSLSHPDVNATIMRPAFPTANRTPQDHGITKQDAGVKNVDLVTRVYPWAPATPYYPPAMPARRLFQLPDDVTGPINSNATITLTTNGTQIGYVPPQIDTLQDPNVNLANNGNPSKLLNAAEWDPHFRSEWLQKLMNLSTVRTHQYAVWITIGFFQVTAVGDAAAAATSPNAAYDVIGREVGTLAGKTVRHRGFFIVDRLKLGGFDPRNPGQYKEAVLYRKMIQ